MRHAFACTVALLSLLTSSAYAEMSPEERAQARLDELRASLPPSQTENLLAAQAELRHVGSAMYDEKTGMLGILTKDGRLDFVDHEGTVKITRWGKNVSFQTEYRREPSGNILRKVYTTGMSRDRYLNANGTRAWFGAERWYKAGQALRAKR
jgi:hypothetical protein